MIGQHILEDGLETVGRSRPTVSYLVAVRRTALVVAAAACLLSGPPVAAQESELALQLQRVRRDLSDLQAYIYSGKAPSREAIAEVVESQAGSPQSAARLQVQLQDLEAQMRTLTGRIEEIEYKINRISERVEKLVADVDVRFQALESGKTQGAGGPAPGAPGPRSEGPASAGGLQVASTGERPVTGTGGGASKEGLEVGQQVLGTMSSTGGAQAVKPPLETMPEEANGRAALQPKDDGKVASAARGPRERYDEAFQYLRRSEYDKAAVAFDAFVKENPESPLSSNALYWLGETHYFRKDYAEAARVFLDGYKRYPKGNKAPDNLFKLGKSLAAINETKPACAAWNKLLKAYPNANKRLLGNAKSEMSKINCS